MDAPAKLSKARTNMQRQALFPNWKSSERFLLFISGVALGLFSVLCPAASPPLYISSGTNNPLSAGAFAESHFSVGPPIITTTNGNDGEDYWQLNTGPFPGDSGSGYYHFHPAASDMTDPSGWTLTYRAKVLNADRNFESFIAVVTPDACGWVLTFVGGPNASAPVGMKYYQAGQESSFPAVATPLPGSSDPSLEYHSYQIIYNPGTAAASFYIDGTFSASLARTSSIFACAIGNGHRIEWGDGQGTGATTGSATRWSLVKFEVGQHPLSLSEVAVQHVGANDPLAEGFLFNQAGTPPPTLSGANDGEAYWRIYQPPPDGGFGSAYYRYNLAIPNLTACKWTLTLRAKVNRSAGTGGPGNAYVAVVDGNDGWVLNLRGGSDVPPGITGLFYYDSNFLPVRLSPFDPTGVYRTYQMVYDPDADGGNGSVRYSVDGTVVGTLTRVQVIDVGGPRVEWGDGEGDGGLADAQYGLVRFEFSQNLNPAHSSILSRSPNPNAVGIPADTVLDITLQDGAARVQTNMIQLFFNDLVVSPTITRLSGTNLTTIHYDPPGSLSLESSNTVKLIFNDTANTLVTNVWSFRVTDGRVTIVEHVGMNSPTCETWTFSQSAPAILSADIDPEGFWQIQQADASASYGHSLVSSNLTDQSGWTATMRVKLNRANGANTGLLNSYLSVADGYDAWILSIGGGADMPSSSRGVFDFFGARYTSIDPTIGYRNYQMVYNPTGDGGKGSVTYYLDGLVIGTETRAHAPNVAALRIEFGDGDRTSDGGASDAQYALVRLELGQHPLPGLTLSQVGDQLTLSWSASGFRLQTNSNLAFPAGWADLPGGTNSPKVVTVGPGPLFFRLRQY